MSSIRFSLLALSALAVAFAHPPQAPYGSSGSTGSYGGQKTLAAVCDLRAATGSTVGGQVMLVQNQPDGPVRFSGLIHGLTAGQHGFHLHAKGDLNDDCKAAGGHFNPQNVNHGAPTDQSQHAGDFGNIVSSDQGVATLDFQTLQVSLDANSVNGALGRAIVVHALPDDLGRGNTDETLKTGSAGARVACCVVTEACYSSRCP